MLNPVNSYASIAYATRPRAVRDPREEQARAAAARAPGPGADRVTLSASGQRRAAFSRIVSDQTRGMSGLQNGDPKALLSRAHQRLQSILGDLGMAGDTPVQIATDSDGGFAVAANGRSARQLEREVNGDPQLTHTLTAAANLTRVGRVAAATANAYQAAEANPAGEQRYYDWAQGVAHRSMGMPTLFEDDGSGMTATLTDAAGNPVGTTDGLTPPA